MTTARPPRERGRVVVCGGGCYGSYYVRQLVRATRAGAFRADDVVVVDRDPDCRVARLLATAPEEVAPLRLHLVTSEWMPFFDRWFATVLRDPAAHHRDAVVPSPLMPHLLAEWAEQESRRTSPAQPLRRAPMPVAPATPWQREGDGPTHYASFATWMCPINCIEPARCPETRGPRDWSMPVAVRQAAAEAAHAGAPYDHVAVFSTLHEVWGVGMFSLDPLPALAAAVGQGARRVLVASVSHCHGALATLEAHPVA